MTARILRCKDCDNPTEYTFGGLCPICAGEDVWDGSDCGA